MQNKAQQTTKHSITKLNKKLKIKHKPKLNKHGCLCILHFGLVQYVFIRTNRVAAAGETALAGGVSVVVIQASLTVRPIRIVSTVAAVTSVTSGPIQLRIEVTFGTLSVAVTSWNRETTSITFTFKCMHLADAFIKAPYSAFKLHIFLISMCIPWELNPQPFALLTQCSTAEPQDR